MVQWYDEVVAGGISGMAGVCVGHPFDTVKVKMQTSMKYTSPLQCLRGVAQTNGIRALFNGIIPPLGIATAVNAVLFFSYEFSLRAICGFSPARNADNNKQEPTLAQIYFAGTFGGLTQTFVCVPAEVSVAICAGYNMQLSTFVLNHDR
jgi:solute carrier family 25 (mitochondrial carnitine/acylcarnitine transporter), member 20/29